MEFYDKTLTEVTDKDIQNGTFEFPEGIKAIGKLAFFNCRTLRHITIPEGVETIGEYAFRSCINLTSVEIPSSVKFIRGNSFSVPDSHLQKNPIQTVVVTSDRKIDERFRSCFPQNAHFAVKTPYFATKNGGGLER